MNLEDANVLVTGGSSGIGFEIAQVLKAEGAQVAICGRNAERLHQAAEKIDALPIQADVSKEDEVKGMITKVIEKFGGYNVLINNAGFGRFGSLVDTSTVDFHKVWEVNVLGAFLVGRESTRYFIEQNAGNIVNVSSTAGLKGFANGTAYVASKFALSGMTECWRAELRKYNIRVMQINPSEVISDFARRAGLEQEITDNKLRSEEIAHVIKGMLSLNDRGFITDATVWATNPFGS